MNLEQPRKSRSLLESALIDGSIFCGMGLLAFGAWLAFPPAGFMVGGALLLTFGVMGARR